ncbi:MAG: alpha/beta hydrolase [Rhodospirillaceae bacterium]
MLEWAVRILSVALLAWLFIATYLYIFQRSILYVPGPVAPPPSQTQASMADAVTLKTADGLELLAWWLAPPEDAAKVVVYFHGNAGNLQDREVRVPMLQEAGFGALMVEWRGFGGNPGAPSQEGLLEDGRAALAFLEARGIGPDRWVIYGESLGSGVSFLLMAERLQQGLPGPALIVTEGAFTSAVDVAAKRYPFLPVRPLMKDHWNSMAALPALSSVPLLVLHGQQDHIISPAMGRALLEAYPGPKRGHFPQEAKHVDLFMHGAVKQMVDFLAETSNR